MSKRALVTGGLGFIGFHLVQELHKQGWDITALDWDSKQDAKIQWCRNNSVKCILNDFAAPLVLDDIFYGTYDYVFHLAATPRVSYSVEHPLETHENNVSRTMKLLEACRNTSVKRFIFSSSSSVYGGAEVMPTPEYHIKFPKSPYALQKSIIEDYCKMYSNLYGLETICLRYFNVFGVGAKADGAYATAITAWLHSIKNNLPLRSDGDGTQSRDLCHVDNVVSANILAAINTSKEFSGDCYNVACGQRTSNNEILQYLLKLYPNVEIQNAPWRAGDVMHTHASIDKIGKELGYQPKMLFWDGLKQTISGELGK